MNEVVSVRELVQVLIGDVLYYKIYQVRKRGRERERSKRIKYKKKG